ncbi:MAG: hypothetical protein NWF00_11660 [Candidatus Bathyarchaeota archaeon]|nr:hypothetical protein [Candidatus Bathyarchaeota archaeon]
MSLTKPKSWSVNLVNGYLLNGEVRADHCKGCDGKTKLLIGNNGDPDLFLYGCNTHKCKHVLIRLKFDEALQYVSVPMSVTETTVAVFQEVSDTVQHRKHR